ncbi:phage adaptor protein [Solidesulfovibrio carbinolicus]|uniref:Uncharacterized protein n=1 Tax=Solidesulfovibrio carbinolicus TaxID=296842 RepID=A0A4P6HP82_9BACT|nr:hypothetical protein [Solidesulfovibrio carbinolicus]QAZ69081.1 hypothetical protein C3Y92_18295 [Solidesulfovibrio carbinolicus]
MAMAAMNLPRADAQGIRRAVPDSLAGLTAEVSGIVGDPSVSEDDVAQALGRGLLAAAAAARLPDLAAWAEIPLASGQADAPLPADLLHAPVDAFLLPARGRVRLAPDLAALRRSCPATRPGRPRLAALAGGRLHVRPVPAGDVIIGFEYGRLPAPLAAPGDKPEGLPVHLAGPLLVAYACRELFERLEEGADGAKTQTAAYGKRYEALLAELTATTSPRQTAPADIPSAADPYGFGEDWP